MQIRSVDLRKVNGGSHSLLYRSSKNTCDIRPHNVFQLFLVFIRDIFEFKISGLVHKFLIFNELINLTV